MKAEQDEKIRRAERWPRWPKSRIVWAVFLFLVFALTVITELVRNQSEQDQIPEPTVVSEEKHETLLPPIIGGTEQGRPWSAYVVVISVVLAGIILILVGVKYRRDIKVFWQSLKKKWRTIVFLPFALFLFYVFMVRRYPGFQISLGKLFDSEWRELFLFTSVFIFGIVILLTLLVFHRRIWLHALGLWVGTLIVLGILGYRPVFRLDGSYKSYSAFELLQPDARLMRLYRENSENPDFERKKFLALHKNDHTEISFRAKEGDVIAIWAGGSIRYGRMDILAEAVRRGRAFSTPETKRKLRDPNAHPFSPVLGYKSQRLGVISAYRGGPNSPEQKGGAVFFLLVTAEGGGLYIFPSNMPKSTYFYPGHKGGGVYSSNVVVKVYHFPREMVANL